PTPTAETVRDATPLSCADNRLWLLWVTAEACQAVAVPVPWKCLERLFQRSRAGRISADRSDNRASRPGVPSRGALIPGHYREGLEQEALGRWPSDLARAVFACRKGPDRKKACTVDRQAFFSGLERAKGIEPSS